MGCAGHRLSGESVREDSMGSYGRERSSSPPYRRADRGGPSSYGRDDRPPRLCKDFMHGRCTYERCRFSHDGGGGGGGAGDNGAPRGPVGGAGPGRYVDGDWCCGDCREHNFARRDICFKVSFQCELKLQ
jgi:hypothetical protein